MPSAKNALVHAFENFLCPPEKFSHAEHVHVAYEILNVYDFVTASTRYADTIQAMAKQAGAPMKFNATITYAFMSIIAERKAASATSDYNAFIAENPDLLERTLLSQYYSKERMTSALARAQFLLPDKGTL